MKSDLIQIDGKFYKKSRVVMLPSTTSSRLFLRDGNLEYAFTGTPLGYDPPKWLTQHLYFLSVGEMNRNDSYLFQRAEDLTKIAVARLTIDGKIEVPRGRIIGKIISSTDKLLEVPRPSDAFLKAYCEQGGIDEVLVELKPYYESAADCHAERNIQGYDLKLAPDNTITIKELKPVQETWTKDQVLSLLNNQIEFVASNFFGEPRVQIRKYGKQFIQENLK